MKKIICLIIALLLPVACASADSYLEASFSFSGSSGNRIETIDLYEQENQIAAVSTLIPEYAVIIDQMTGFSLSLFHSICSLNPVIIRDNVQKADSKIRDMIGEYMSDPVPGAYSGELFENAASVRTARFQLYDFLTSAINTLDSTDEPFTDVCKAVLSSLMGSLQQTSDSELFLEIKIYDNWQYVSAMLFDHEQAVMIISSDLSMVNTKRILVSYRENERNYFRDMLIKDDYDAITVTSSLRSGTDCTYQRIMNETPLTTALLTLTNEQFNLKMYGNGLSEPLTATGKTTVQENGEAQMTANLVINNHDAQEFNISINLSQMARPVYFSDKETIYLSDQTENAGLIITAASKETELAAEIIPTLPDEYQKLLIKWLYP